MSVTFWVGDDCREASKFTVGRIVGSTPRA